MGWFRPHKLSPEETVPAQLKEVSAKLDKTLGEARERVQEANSLFDTLDEVVRRVRREERQQWRESHGKGSQ